VVGWYHDTLYTAAQSFVEVRPDANFPLLKINWSINNRPEDGDLAPLIPLLHEKSLKQWSDLLEVVEARHIESDAATEEFWHHHRFDIGGRL
jgi:hypothetical protein